MKKVFASAMFVLGLMLTFSTTAFVMTYSIQIVAGVVVAAGAVIGIYWRKAKKKVQDKLGIDENANKTVEEDVVEIIENDEEAKDN